MIKRLPQSADPEAIAETIKTLKTRWPRLAALAETSAPQSGGGRVGTEAQRATTETLVGIAETFSQEAHTEQPQSETRSANPLTIAKDPQTPVQEPLTKRLEKLFGFGNSPTLRLTLYTRIQSIVQIRGKEAEHVLRDVIDASRTKLNPGNYFAYSIVRRFRESGFFREDC